MNLQICTEESPMPEDAIGAWRHPVYEKIGSSPENTVDYYKCSICGETWQKEYSRPHEIPVRG